MSTKRPPSGRLIQLSPEDHAAAQRQPQREYYERLDAYRTRQAAAEAEGIPALRRLVQVARGGSGQCHHVRRFLLGLYNGYRWPFELVRLRALDADLADDCLTVLRMDLTPRKEIHLFLEGGDEFFQKFWEMESDDGEEE